MCSSFRPETTPNPSSFGEYGNESLLLAVSPVGLPGYSWLSIEVYYLVQDRLKMEKKIVNPLTAASAPVAITETACASICHTQTPIPVKVQTIPKMKPTTAAGFAKLHAGGIPNSRNKSSSFPLLRIRRSAWESFFC
jgi:hypothetical protein